MSRRFLPLLVILLAPSFAPADGLPPDEAVERMKLPDGFGVRCVASEPMIRQPVSISFDARGRMWVLQYLQYPNYAGLKPVKQDQYLRTIWDRVPEPPPHGPKGLDRITILSDPDEHGVFRQSKDFVTGLNIASGFCLGNGGVYVVQPPYLLFYPDKDEDEVPDGDPEVLLTGFGMNDTHSLANSLQWGPDGWLYGAAGSTSTCKITNPAAGDIIEFQQGIWRYHPKTKRFELFSEGGGNTYGLDFDKHGQAIAGTNNGGKAMLHQMQGAYYVKGFTKHGPLHNPHTYGYFDHVPYTGFKGGHVTCGGIVYQADVYPEKYRDEYIAANLLSNAIYWHDMTPKGASFTATFGGDLMTTDDVWFRPIDLLQGPDGCVYVVDWYDRRAAHLDPIDNWDKTNGRVYRIEYNGGPKYPTFDLRKKPSAELVKLLKHPNKWWRNEARRILGERQDASVYPQLRKWVAEEKGVLALESLWALYVSGGWDEKLSVGLLKHPDEYMRAWAVRFLGDDPTATTATAELVQLGLNETSPVVLAQLACTAKRLPPPTAVYVVQALLLNPASAGDPHLPLLIWWAAEAAITRDIATGGATALPPEHPTELVKLNAERVAHRLMAGDLPDGPRALAALIPLWEKHDVAPLLTGMAKSLEGRTLKAVPEELAIPLTRLRSERPDDEWLLAILARMGDADAIATFEKRPADEKASAEKRVEAINVLRELHTPEAKALFLAGLPHAKADSLKVAFLGGLEAFDDPAVGETVFQQYPSWSKAVKKRAVQLLLSRPTWALALLQRFDRGDFPKDDLTLDHAKTAVGLNDSQVTALVEKHFGKLQSATPGEKQARISWLNVAMSRNGSGDPAAGKVLYTKHCAACHTLHGEGGKVGPDLTTADRKNRVNLLMHIVDPSGFIRPEFLVQNVITADGRRLSGIVNETGGESVQLVNVVEDKPQNTEVAKANIETMTPSAVSLMPEKLLDTLSDVEVGHLFAYLMGAPVADAPGAPDQKKLQVVLVSGSFEYESDESLAAFEKYLEANYPVECTLVRAKMEKDKSLAGLEALDTADVAVFFTRRLRVEGEDLDRIKKFVKAGKPVIGIRTASHGFQNWLEMDKAVFGGDYQGHFGKNVECTVAAAAAAKDHPVLKGVSGFTTTGSLYKNPKVADDVTVLLTGTIPKEPAQPVAWVREQKGQRVFYTSLGHPDDFKDAAFLRLLVNALAWATKTELNPPGEPRP